MKGVNGSLPFLIAALVSALFLTAGCGRKGDPVAPEDYQPRKEKAQDAGGETRRLNP